jgi:Ca2+-binding RTX toxin-like protein
MQQLSTQRSSLVSFDVLESRRLMAADTFVLANGTLTENGTDGNDHITIENTGDFLSITMNDQHKVVSGFPVTPVFIYGLDGNDRIDAPYAAYVNGGRGNDIITSAITGAVLTGGPGNDRISAGVNGNRLNGGGGNDTLNGGSDRDRLYGDDGQDLLNGNAGVDVMHGGAGNDLLDGGKSTDYLFGEGGNDTILGSDGSDSLDGGSGDDSLNADGGDDTLFGGAGNDTLIAGTGHDTLFGNAGADDLQMKDLTFDIADGGSGSDRAFIDDFEKTFVVAERRST